MRARHLSMCGAYTTWTPWLLRPFTGCSQRVLHQARGRLPVLTLSFPRLFAHVHLTAALIQQPEYQMGQAPSTSAPTKPEIHVVDPPKPEVQVMNPPNFDLRVLDPPKHPPTGLALIAHGRNATLDCPVVGTLATYLRESHGCRTVTWSARGVGNSEGTKGPDSENRKDYNVSLVYGRTYTKSRS